MRLALYQPDIPQNVGAAIRVAACFGAPLDIVGPCGFPLDDKAIRRVAMDYADLAAPVLHSGWRAFLSSAERRSGRLVLLTTKAGVALWDFAFSGEDIVLVGRESAGAPPEVHDAADARVGIPISPQARSLNVAVAAAIALAEASRQFRRRSGESTLIPRVPA
jgi:tRNA (cytidine/uridine-2'-O-)-methyltransferase